MSKKLRKQKCSEKVKHLDKIKVQEDEGNIPEANLDEEDVLNLYLSDASDLESEDANPHPVRFPSKTTSFLRATSESPLTSHWHSDKNDRKNVKFIKQEIGTSRTLSKNETKTPRNKIIKIRTKLKKEPLDLLEKAIINSEKVQKSSRQKKNLNCKSKITLSSDLNSKVKHCFNLPEEDSPILSHQITPAKEEKPSRKKRKLNCNDGDELSLCLSDSDENENAQVLPGKNCSQSERLGDCHPPLLTQKEDSSLKIIFNNKNSLATMINNQDQIMKTQNHILDTLVKMEKILNCNFSTTLANQKKIGLLESKLSKITQLISASTSDDQALKDSPMDMPTLPATTAEEFNRIERYLNDENNMKHFVYYIKDCVGSSPEAFAKAAMEIIMTNKVKANFSMGGCTSGSSKNKIVFSGTKTYEAILESARLHRGTKVNYPKAKVGKCLQKAPR